MTGPVETEGTEPAFLERAEALWLKLAVLVLVLFLAGVGVVTWFGFTALPRLVREHADYAGEVCTTPERLLGSAAFASPGVIPRPDGGVDVYMVGRMWEWTPNDIHVPVGRPVRFLLTSADVLHGFLVLDTPVNIMVFPGMVATEEFTFTRPGIYRVACTEYCGVGHQDMVTEIHVEAAQ